MKYIKSYKKFQENAVATASSTAGSGPVVSATVGSLPGVGAIDGSGDLAFHLVSNRKRKRGTPSQVSDLRDLAPAKGVTHVKESDFTTFERSQDRNPKYNKLTKDLIDDCLVELRDLDFTISSTDYTKDKNSVEIDDEKSGDFIEELRISSTKLIQKIWTGNIIAICKFDESGIISKEVMTLRGSGNSLTQSEEELFRTIEEISQKLIGNLDYQKGLFKIQWRVVGPGMPLNSEREISVSVQFVLVNNLKE